MSSRRPVGRGALGVLSVLGLGLAPGVARAHDATGSRFDAPLPLSLLFVGAGATVALTALWLAFSDRDVAPPSRRRLGTIPAAVATPLRYGVRGLFFAGVLAALALGVAGRQVAENFATVFTWPVWFRGVALLAVLLGNPWPALSPWRTLYDGIVRIEGRTVAALGSYPSAAGTVPALIGFVVLIGVVENLTVVPRVPRLTVVVVATYGLAMLGGSVLVGPAWLRRADPLGVLYELLGRVAPVDISRTDAGGCELAVRPPWRGCLVPVGGASTVAFVVATVYTVSFDGFTETQSFQTTLFAARDALGTGSGTSVLLYLGGLAAFVCAFGLASRLVERFGAGTGRDWPAAARRFAPTVLPIAAAYEVAHNYPYVIRSAGQLLALAARPLSDAIGPFDPLGWLSLPLFWGSQVALIVLGHVVAVVAAHRVALDRYDSAAAARRGHLPLVALMVGYTVLSLWIVSRPVVSG